MELAKPRQDLVTDQAALRVAVRAVDSEVEILGAAIGFRLLAPDGEHGPDDSVLAFRLDPARRSARDQPVEDGLDLVGGGVAGRAQPVGRERVADLAELVLRPPTPSVHNLR